MVALAPNLDAPVPELRGELQVIFQGRAGARKALIYDPLAHRYFELSKQSTALLQNWSLGSKTAILDAVGRLGDQIPEDSIETLSQFLVFNGLAKHPGEAQGYALWHKQRALKKTVAARFAALLFFRIPFGNPDRFISAVYTFAWPMLTLSFRWLTGLVCLFALWLLSNMPEIVSTHLRDLVSLQGAPELLIALALVKLCHELGHGLQAKRFGLKVPSGGIMFLLGLPLPFVELSSAWQLERKADRLRIDAGGILAELAVAAWCLLAFACWPDGMMRSLFFAMATSSIVMTLLVNLNPLMRFDGYFLLSDAIEIKNLQPRSIALMKWRLREFLFRISKPCPEPWTPKARRWLIVYAIALCLYRVMLFIGIAVMAYAILNKVLGILVFVFQIAFFIGLPILKELQVWWKMREEIAQRRRIWISGSVFAGLVALLLIPFPQYFTVPARLSNGQSAEYFAPRLAVLTDSQITRSDLIASGQGLWRFSKPATKFAIERLRSQIAALDGRIQRMAAGLQTRSQAQIFKSERERLVAELATLEKELGSAHILATNAGSAASLTVRLDTQPHGPIALAANTLLGSIITPAPLTIKALVPARVREHLPKQVVGKFRSGIERAAPELPRKVTTGPIHISSSPISVLTLPEAGKSFGGVIATDPKNPERPQKSWYALDADVVENVELDVLMSIPGDLILKGNSRSYGQRAWTQIARTLVQNLGN